MRKKSLILIGVLIVITAIVLFIVSLSKSKYLVKASKIDDQSPDRVLTVFNDNNETVEFKRIEFVDGTFLCNSLNPTVYFGTIQDVKKVKVILKDKSEVVAQVVEEEVN